MPSRRRVLVQKPLVLLSSEPTSNMTAHFLSSLTSEVRFDSKPPKKLGSMNRRRNTWFVRGLKGSCDCGGGHLGWGPCRVRVHVS